MSQGSMGPPDTVSCQFASDIDSNSVSDCVNKLTHFGASAENVAVNDMCGACPGTCIELAKTFWPRLVTGLGPSCQFCVAPVPAPTDAVRESLEEEVAVDDTCGACPGTYVDSAKTSWPRSYRGLPLV